MQASDAVRIDAPQIGARQHIGSLRGIFPSQAKVEKYASAEFTQNVDRKNLCFDIRHSSSGLPTFGPLAGLSRQVGYGASIVVLGFCPVRHLFTSEIIH